MNALYGAGHNMSERYGQISAAKISIINVKNRFILYRILMVSSREHCMPRILGMIHVHNKTPLPAAIAAVSEWFYLL